MDIKKFQEGLHVFQASLEELAAGVKKEREDLAKAAEQLSLERKQFQEETQRVQFVLNEAEQVTLNVGGHKFTTTVTTLKNAPFPSLFNAMFSGRHTLKKDDAGCFFIDRDGRYFHDILNFLRDGRFSYPPDGRDFKYLLELRSEAEFYGLTGLVTLIDRYPYNVTTVQRAATLNMEDSWMFEDGQDEIVMTVDKPCQLLGVGFCGTEGGLTVELEVLEVASDDFSTEVAKLCECAQSFTKADGTTVRMFLPSPVPLVPGKFYMLTALIQGTESFCGEDCMEVVVASGVKVEFQNWESPNGTTNTRGQFPEIYIRVT